MTIEVERKFVVIDTPDYGAAAGRRLRQGYVAQEDDVEVRVRVSDERDAWLTVKAGHGLVRTEVELALTLDQAEALWAHTPGRRLSKTRHTIDIDGREASVDVYHDELEGLVVAEIEFTSEQEAAEFTPPAWFAREVTGVPGWDNATLARRGTPPEGAKNSRYGPLGGNP